MLFLYCTLRFTYIYTSLHPASANWSRRLIISHRYDPATRAPSTPGYGAGSGAPNVMLAYLKHIWMKGQRPSAYSRCGAKVGQGVRTPTGRVSTDETLSDGQVCRAALWLPGCLSAKLSALQRRCLSTGGVLRAPAHKKGGDQRCQPQGHACAPAHVCTHLFQTVP